MVMTWKPNMRNRIQEIPKDNVMPLAIRGLVNAGIIKPFPTWSRRKLEDDNGEYGKVGKNFIILARKSLYGNILSIHKDAIARGIEEQIPLVVYFKDMNKYYKFDPEEIFRTTGPEDENRRGKSIMVNFKISMGVRFEV